MGKIETFYKNLPKGRCNPCRYARAVGTWEGYMFLGCYHRPYKGKSVAEIKNCPKESEVRNG